jgi:hypothetical protein
MLMPSIADGHPDHPYLTEIAVPEYHELPCVLDMVWGDAAHGDQESVEIGGRQFYGRFQ